MAKRLIASLLSILLLPWGQVLAADSLRPKATARPAVTRAVPVRSSVAALQLLRSSFAKSRGANRAAIATIVAAITSSDLDQLRSSGVDQETLRLVQKLADELRQNNDQELVSELAQLKATISSGASKLSAPTDLKSSKGLRDAVAALKDWSKASTSADESEPGKKPEVGAPDAPATPKDNTPLTKPSAAPQATADARAPPSPQPASQVEEPKGPVHYGSAIDPYVAKNGNPGRIAAFVFDWDGNLVSMPTKIYLYKKGGEEELAVSPEEWTQVEGQLGQPGKFKDFEVRGDKSFREFRGDRFGQELENLVAHQPPSAWQRSSFDALAYATSRPETASWVFIASAREAAPQAFRDAVEKSLVQRGYLGSAPILENIGMLGGAKNIPEAKADFHRKVLDKIAAVAVAENAPLSLNAAGTRREKIHLWGFSDDDWKNIEATVAKLAPDSQRWKNIKRVVWFTGKNEPNHAPGAYAITPDNKLRPLTTDEYGEGYVQYAVKTDGKSKPRYKVPPYPNVVRMALSTIDKLIKKMYVSYPYDNEDPAVAAGADLLNTEIDAIERHLNDASVPDELKEIVLTRYSVASERLAQVMKKAVAKNIRFTFIADFNTSMDFEFKEGMKPLADFRKGKPKDNPAGEFLKMILDAGFKIGDSNARQVIYSQPLYNKGDAQQDPIMHEKSLILIVHENAARNIARKLALWFGTANLTGHVRYNRLFEIDSPEAAEFVLAHSMKMAKAFEAGKTIADTESEPPLRIMADDDSFMEIAFTNGEYQPGERMINLMERAADDPEHYKLTGEFDLDSQFAATNGDAYSAQKEARKVQQGVAELAVSDEKFIAPWDFGKMAVMVGIPLIPPMGRGSFGWLPWVSKGINSYVHLRMAEGVPETNLEGEPLSRVLWHDKTEQHGIIEFLRKWTYTATGSFNKSKHVANAEMQVVFRFAEASPWPKRIFDSVAKAMKKQPQYFDTTLRAVLRAVFTAMTRHVPAELSREGVDKFQQAIEDGNAAAVASGLEALVESPTQLKKSKMTEAEAKKNVENFTAFMTWYLATDEMKQRLPLTLQRAIAAALTLVEPGISGERVRTALNSVFWHKDLTGQQIEELMSTGAKKLGFRGGPAPAEPKTETPKS